MGADISATDKSNGYTPLHLASRNGQESVVELLIEEGADHSVVDNFGRIPLDIAQLRGYTKDV